MSELPGSYARVLRRVVIKGPVPNEGTQWQLDALQHLSKRGLVRMESEGWVSTKAGQKALLAKMKAKLSEGEKQLKFWKTECESLSFRIAEIQKFIDGEKTNG